MGALADGALENSGQVIGVIVESMNTPALAHHGLTRRALRGPKTLASRIGISIGSFNLGWISNYSTRDIHMLIVQCTQKLLRLLELPLREPPTMPDNTLLGVWYANIITFKRFDFLLFVNDPTLYAVISYLPEKAYPGQIAKLLKENLATALIEDGVIAKNIQCLLDEYEQTVFAKTTSRSLLGHLNDLKINMLAYVERDIAEYGKSNLQKIQRLLNRIPQRKLGWGFAVEAMLEKVQPGQIT